MSRMIFSGIAVLGLISSASAHGLLIPEDRQVPPLAMVHHHVKTSIEEQVAVTEVQQTFRNHTDRELEATYVFPVPRGASVNKFTMTVGGKEMSGEMLDATKARQVYTDIIRRTQDPGLLEYMGNNLMRLRVFPVPPKGDLPITLRYTSIAPQESGLIEYVYPLKTDGKATRTLEDFSIQATIKSQSSIINVYSPTHAITYTRPGEREVKVDFARQQALLDKDFQLFYALGSAEVGLTPLIYKPISSEGGYFLFLISPLIDAPKSAAVPRDIVLLMDTSGSMAGVKIDQARKALRLLLDNLNPQDRFAVLNFSTTVGRYRDQLVESSKEQIENAKKWVDNLRAAGGTAIDDALGAALAMRPEKNDGRVFTVIFFTDGQPTVGETRPERILKRLADKNTAETRIFTLGVGDDVNAAFLDQVADQTRAASAYVRPAEDIEVKASGLASKISHPVLTNLQLTVGANVRLEETYPPQLPDLFHGSQLVVLGRYAGHGPTTIKLKGNVGAESREFVYEMNLPERGGVDRDFVEHLWARRKVGYLLDQIRNNGEKKELIDEVTVLAKKYGIATPYTSYLIVPDGPVSVLSRGGATYFGGFPRPESLGGAGGRAPGGAAPVNVVDLARQVQEKPGDLAKNRDAYEDGKLKKAGDSGGEERKVLAEAASKKEAFDRAKAALVQRQQLAIQAGKLGVDLAVEANNLRNQSRLSPTALKNVAGRNCLELGGVWIDEDFDAKMPTVTVKAHSPAYFQILDRQPQMKEVFRLGNHLLWVTPNKTALVIDTTEGKEQLSTTEIDSLFLVKK